MTAPSPRTNKRLVLAVPVLLLVAVLVNLGTLEKIMSGEKSLRSIVYGLSEGRADTLAGWRVPPDSGSAQAKVVIEVFMVGGDPCHLDSALLGQALGRIDPERLRVKFVNTMGSQANAARREAVKLGCDQGLAINGQTEFKVPDPAQPGRQKTVFTAHQHDAGVMSQALLHFILDRQLQAAYHGKGLALSKEAFAAKLQNDMTLAKVAMAAEHKAATEAAKQQKQ